MGLQGPVGRWQRTGAGNGSLPYIIAWLAIAAIVLTAAIAATPSAAVLEPLGSTATRLGPSHPTAAATRRGTDAEARVRFTLDGRLLAVRLLRRAPGRTHRAVYGRRIRAVCGTDFNFTRGTKVRRTRFWPRGQRRVRFRFRRNISRRAKWCLIEHPPGGDVAFASLVR